MPNRIIKESIKRSPQIDQLSWFEEVVFYRLIVTVDDYGCYDGRTIVLKNDLFPAKDSVTKKSVEDAIAKLIRIGLVERYEVNELPYIHLLTWERHQRMDKARRKYPLPEDVVFAVSGNLPEFPGTSGNFPPESESNPNPNPNPNPIAPNGACAEPERPAAAPAAVLLPLIDGSDYAVSEEQREEWAGLYPAVDVMQELRSMRGWLLANEKNRKTRQGILRFANNWLSKEQNRARRSPGSGSASKTTDADEMQRYLQQLRMTGGNT